MADPAGAEGMLNPTPNPFDVIPVELVHIVLSRLSFHEVQSFRLSCRTCQCLGEYPPLWERYYLQRFGGTIPRTDLAVFELSGASRLNYRILYRRRQKRVRRRARVRKIIREKRRKTDHRECFGNTERGEARTVTRRAVRAARAVHTTYRTTLDTIRLSLAVATFFGLVYLVLHRVVYGSVNNSWFSSFLP